MNTRRVSFAHTLQPHDYGSDCVGCIPRPSDRRSEPHDYGSEAEHTAPEPERYGAGLER
jgi:hypothetical protein